MPPSANESEVEDSDPDDAILNVEEWIRQLQHLIDADIVSHESIPILSAMAILTVVQLHMMSLTSSLPVSRSKAVAHASCTIGLTFDVFALFACILNSMLLKAKKRSNTRLLNHIEQLTKDLKVVFSRRTQNNGFGKVALIEAAEQVSITGGTFLTMTTQFPNPTTGIDDYEQRLRRAMRFLHEIRGYRWAQSQVGAITSMLRFLRARSSSQDSGNPQTHSSQFAVVSSDVQIRLAFALLLSTVSLAAISLVVSIFAFAAGSVQVESEIWMVCAGISLFVFVLSFLCMGLDFSWTHWHLL